MRSAARAASRVAMRLLRHARRLRVDGSAALNRHTTQENRKKRVMAVEGRIADQRRIARCRSSSRTAPARKIEPATQIVSAVRRPARSRALGRVLRGRPAAPAARRCRARSAAGIARGVGAAVAITDETTGSNVCAMSATFLSRITPITSGGRSGCQRVRYAARARAPSGLCAASSRTRRPRSSGEQLESRRPFGRGQPLLDGVFRNGDAIRGGDLQQPHRDDRIAHLMLAAQSQRHRSVRRQTVWPA